MYIITENYYGDHGDYISNMVCATFSKEKAEEIKAAKEKELLIINDLKLKFRDIISKWELENPRPELATQIAYALNKTNPILVKYRKDWVDWFPKHKTYFDNTIASFIKEHNVREDFYNCEDFTYDIEEVEVV